MDEKLKDDMLKNAEQFGRRAAEEVERTVIGGPTDIKFDSSVLPDPVALGCKPYDRSKLVQIGDVTAECRYDKVEIGLPVGEDQAALLRWAKVAGVDVDAPNPITLHYPDGTSRTEVLCLREFVAKYNVTIDWDRTMEDWLKAQGAKEDHEVGMCEKITISVTTEPANGEGSDEEVGPDVTVG